MSMNVQALRALRVGALDLRPPRHAPSGPAGSPCAVVVHPLAGLREVSQSAMTRIQLAHFLVVPAAPGAIELAQCANAYLYDGDWPLQAAAS